MITFMDRTVTTIIDRADMLSLGGLLELAVLVVLVVGIWSVAKEVWDNVWGVLLIGTVILGVLTSGFTFLRIDAYYQEIMNGMVIVAAVIADQYRLRKRKGT